MTFYTFSYLDRSKRINEKEWALTLISEPRSYHGHACIVIEGMRDGKIFRSTVDLIQKRDTKDDKLILTKTGRQLGEVRCCIPTEDELIRRAHRRSVTWLRSPKQIQKMQSAMKKDEIAGQENHLIFNILGRYSVFSSHSKSKEYITHVLDGERYVPLLSSQQEKTLKGRVITRSDNCASWAVRMLKKANIDVERGAFARIGLIPNLLTTHPTVRKIGHKVGHAVQDFFSSFLQQCSAILGGTLSMASFA
jgi:hypothetical protein